MENVSIETNDIEKLNDVMRIKISIKKYDLFLYQKMNVSIRPLYGPQKINIMGLQLYHVAFCKTKWIKIQIETFSINEPLKFENLSPKESDN